jgi:hypothetical protein
MELKDADGKKVPYLRNSRMLFDREERDIPIGLYKQGLDLIAQGGCLNLILGILAIIAAILLFAITLGAAALTKHQTRDVLYLCTYGCGVMKVLLTNWS